MSGVGSIVEMDMVVVRKFWVSPNDDAYLTETLVPHKVSVFEHFVSNGSRFTPCIISMPLGRATCQKSVHGWYRLMMMPISKVPLLLTRSPSLYIFPPLFLIHPLYNGNGFVLLD